MRNKFGRIIALVICIFTLLGNFTVFGASSYSSYTYSINGDYLLSPDAYIPHVVIDSEHMGLDMADTTPLTDPNDIETDEFGNVYISESGANRIVVLDPYYKKIREIAKFTNHHGVADSLNGPEGLCVKGDKIYVCDSENNRIVIFKTDGSFYKIVEEPESDVFPANSIYKPVAVAVDDSGRLYIVSSTTYMGVIAMTEDGVFQGFIGAQKVTPDVLDIIWRRFETEEQRSLGTQYIPTEFNNITIDERGFLFVTTSSIDESTQQSAIESKSKSGAAFPR